MNPQDKRWQIHRHPPKTPTNGCKSSQRAKRILLVGADADISHSLLPRVIRTRYSKNTTRAPISSNRRSRA